MRRKIQMIGVLIAICGFAVASQKLTQSYKGVEITITRVDRRAEWKFSKDIVLQPKEGNEYLVVTLELKWSTEARSFEAACSDLYLTDKQGQKHNCREKRHRISAGSESSSSFEIPFEVPLGTDFRAFNIEDVSFDLSKLKVSAAQ